MARRDRLMNNLGVIPSFGVPQRINIIMGMEEELYDTWDWRYIGNGACNSFSLRSQGFEIVD